MRDGKTGFTFFNIDGGQYDYDAKAKSLSITGGRLLVSKELAKSLGHASQFGAVAGRISIGATMQPVEITQLDTNGEVKSARLPALPTQPRNCPGPRCHHRRTDRPAAIDQWCSQLVGLSLGTDACNKGTIDVDWFALPNNDHPFIPQNLYRMSSGTD